MNVIQGGPTPVAQAPLNEAVAVNQLAEKTVLPAVAVKAAVKSEAATTGPRYAPHADGELRGRKVNIEA